MMPYSKTWAENIVRQFDISCARARNIDLCIMQMYTMDTARETQISKIHEVKVRSLQGLSGKKIWPAYKRLVKKTPLDRELLKRVTRMFALEIDVDAIQRHFDFGT